MKYILQVGEIIESYEGTPEEIAHLLESQDKYKADSSPRITILKEEFVLPHLQK